MIVRILGQGQFELESDALDDLNALDDALAEAVETGDVDGFASALTKLLSAVRERGREVAADQLVTSDLVLPGPDATIEEVSGLLGEEGLIPG